MDPKPADLAAVVAAMFDLMRDRRGIGLAAPQVGVPYRLFVMSLRQYGFTADFVCINPEILAAGPAVPGLEGCLSFPGLALTVRRAEEITVRYQDLTGETITQDLTGILGRCFCHELDHLDGVVFTQRVGPVARSLAVRRRTKATRRSS
jgi:peptide deformylase